MKKLLAGCLAGLLLLGGLRVIVLEPDKPHTFEVTVPAFTEITAFLGSLADAAGELGEDFAVEEQTGAES
ncbi:MAG: hypothetical protein IJ236_08015 [Oscillospiraceae bacterium]|nr:hypothetical protein [Oscillospiraceae bacterium]MBQ9694959.1 hypothetical protein [Oscillospiraceae bacterium]MBR1459500.1 hypothetical protein [Oscillospiraceae bacterium]MBR1898494.1 hypothetical protein [Oscillospiraceae bacterium]